MAFTLLAVMRRSIAVALIVACSSPKAPEVTQPRFAGIAEAIARGDAPETKSVLVMQRGEVVHEAYFAGADAETLHDTRSVGKSITALAVGIAIDKGVLPGVNASAFAYLTNLAPFAHDGALKQAITVEDFLTMSSALDCNDDDARNAGNEANMYPQENWSRWAVDLAVQQDYQRDANGRGPWHYCTAGTFLLGHVLERAAKQRVDAFIAEQLFAPLGITKWEFTRSPSNEVLTGGMLRLRSRDLGAIMELVRKRGAHGGKQIVPAAFVDAALTVHRNAFPKQDYGYLFWHRTYHTSCGDYPAWYMSGNGGNAVVAVPALDAVVVVTRTHYNQGRRMHDQTTALVENQILPGLCRS